MRNRHGVFSLCLFDVEGIGMDYRIEAIDILLNEDCILQRYFPLIRYRDVLVKNLLMHGFCTKTECMELSHESLIEMGLPDCGMAELFRKFLTMYDVKESKFREIADGDEALRELFLLPGVRTVRARLYYEAGYTSLDRIAHACPDDIIQDASAVIFEKGLEMKAPLPKEVRTHIAVAKVLTEYAV